jgi:hypothetical protein
MSQTPSDLEILAALVAGLTLGWVVGGIYNLINGRTFSGRIKP